MVVEYHVTFKKILGSNILKSKWPPKSKMAAIIYSFMRNCFYGCVYHKTILEICIIMNIYIKLQSSMIYIQMKIQYGRQNLRWPPRRYVLIRKLPKISHIFVVIVKLCIFIFIKCSYTCILTTTFYNQIICDQTNPRWPPYYLLY